MKKIIYILLLIVLFNACKKYESPKPDKVEGTYPFIGGASWYTNKYMLTNINSGNYKKDTVWQKVKDTVLYNNFYIKLDFTGKLVEENAYYGETENIPSLIEQKYFINKIKDFKIYANDKNINSKTMVLKKDKKGVYNVSNIINEELGYTPLKIELTDTLNTSEKIIFEMVFTDDNNNIFETKTDSIFILNN